MKLIKYEAARSALQAAMSVDEVKDIRDKVDALRAYARQRNDTEMEVWLSEIKLRADRRIGEISNDLEKAKPGGAGGGSELPTGGKIAKNEALKQAGISTSTAHRCEQLASLSEAEIEQVVAEAKHKKKPIRTSEVLRRRNREEKVKIIKQGNAALPDENFNVIYADPPWRYEHVKTESRAIENQYPTMTLDEIKALDVPAADDCVLFLWATSPKLSESLEVITSWGFEYRTCAVWDKQKIGMGYYFRQQHELLLVATKGNLPVPEPSNRKPSVFSYKRGKHSSKPIEIYDLITQMYPDFDDSRIELFCRTPQEGWCVWGNQSDGK